MFHSSSTFVKGEGANALLNSITVDVEDYFQTEAMSSVVAREQWNHLPTRVERNTKRLFDLFAAHDVRGTFFFLGWVAERFPGLVREAAGLGHEVGCHSYWHRLVYRLTPDEFREDTKRAKEVTEDAAGARIFGYRAPNFSLVKGTEWAPEILASLGFRYDSSVYPIRHDIYNNPGAPRVPGCVAGGTLMEFPIATLAVGKNNLPLGGGGYLRILPYSYTRWGLSQLNGAKKMSAVVYIHPWEIDPEQPRIAACARSRFRQYTGLGKNAAKLEQLLRDFRFAPIQEVFSKQLGSISTIAPLSRTSAMTIS
jgi:polysaccharide deacetylase family protein (PEP-CTERM system associated)